MKRKADVPPEEHNIVRIKRNPKKQEQTNELKSEILRRFNEISEVGAETFEEINNLYTMAEAYLRTPFGSLQGLQNKTFYMIFDEAVQNILNGQVSIEVYDAIIGDIDSVDSISSMNHVIALLYIHQNMYDKKTDTFKIEDPPTHFSFLRDGAQHAVVEILEVGGYGYFDLACLKERLVVPEIVEVLKKQAGFMYDQMGVVNFSMNIDLTRLKPNHRKFL